MSKMVKKEPLTVIYSMEGWTASFPYLQYITKKAEINLDKYDSIFDAVLDAQAEENSLSPNVQDKIGCDMNSCIIVGEERCKKIGDDIFYNLDQCLAFIIRDTLFEFAKSHTKESYPGKYAFNEDEDIVPDDVATEQWKNDIEKVAHMFNEYSKADDNKSRESIAQKMFEGLAKIFPSLWV